MIYARSACFNLTLYAATVLAGIVLLPVLLLPRPVMAWIVRIWARSVLWLLDAVTGIRHEVRGLERLPPGPVLVAAKHQSMWDTIACLVILSDPALVMKRELMWLPLYGWYAHKMNMIPVNRSAGMRALRRLIAAARAAVDAGRPVIIFPEGTRTPPGGRRPYRSGAAALYTQLGLTCVPVALNSGLFWPRRKFLRHPGVIVVEFQEPIPPGLDRRAFTRTLRARIEPACQRLLETAAPITPPGKTPAPPSRPATGDAGHDL